MLIEALTLIAASAVAQANPIIAPVDDPRMTAVRETDTGYTMTPFSSVKEWDAYADNLRRRIRIAAGLWPEFERTPLNAKVFDPVDFGDYTVSKAHFEAWPGFIVTGNLYMPKGDGPFPGIICPHGHWSTGRIEDGERGSVPARNITFARMGIAAFSYDMVGYNDSKQLPKSWGHSGGDVSEERRKREHLWAIHPFAVQLWSSIRAIDFMASIDKVDGDRIGCTGASGGGTQTFALCAIDDRVQVAAPVNMISHSMQGGCPCENAPLIRINASNMEVGALYAPNPMLMVSATGDWTKETPEVEYPAIRGIYSLYGAADHVNNVHVDAPHNYNLPSREAVYRHFGAFLLKQPDTYAEYTEPEYDLPTNEQMLIFDPEKEGPPEGYAGEDEVITAWRDRIAAKWEAEYPNTYTDAQPFRMKHAIAFADLFGISTAEPLLAGIAQTGSGEADGYRYEQVTIRAKNSGAHIPAVVFHPAKRRAGIPPVLLVHGAGAGATLAKSGGPGPLMKRLLDRGAPVAVVTVFNTGVQAGERKYGRFPDTFMPTDTAYRVQDIITASQWLATLSRRGRGVNVVGLGDAGLWAVMAGAIEPKVEKVIADLNGFNPNDDAQWVERHYVPCIRSLGDIVTAAYLIRPRGLWVMNASPDYDLSRLEKAFSDTGSKAFLSSPDVVPDDQIAAALL